MKLLKFKWYGLRFPYEINKISHEKLNDVKEDLVNQHKCIYINHPRPHKTSEKEICSPVFCTIFHKSELLIKNFLISTHFQGNKKSGEQVWGKSINHGIKHILVKFLIFFAFCAKTFSNTLGKNIYKIFKGRKLFDLSTNFMKNTKNNENWKYQQKTTKIWENQRWNQSMF